VRRRAATRQTTLSEQLGAQILHILADVQSDPALIESLRLYLGVRIESITLLTRRLPNIREDYILDTEGRLTYTKRDTRWDTPFTKRILANVTLGQATDFNKVDVDSVSELHRTVTRDDFLDRLAWRIGRMGKPGYRPSGYEEERDTWRIKSEDPDDPTPTWRRRGQASKRGSGHVRERQMEGSL
jgi:hypothetical protein